MMESGMENESATRQLGTQTRINDEYSIYEGRRLGVGGFGVVYLGWKRSTRELVAIKEFRHNFQKLIEQRQSFWKETMAITKFNHPGIVKLHDFIFPTHLIMEYCEAGELRKKIQAQGHLSEILTFKITQQLVEAMAAVHKENFMHRDLKPENILIMKDQETVKIADFGIARQVDMNNTKSQFTRVGTPSYAAPQIFRSKQYSAKCDVWSLGLIIYEMLTGQMLFPKSPVTKQQFILLFLTQNMSLFSLWERQDIYQGKQFVLEGNYDPFFKNLLARMICFEDDHRASFEQLAKYIKEQEPQFSKRNKKLSYGGIKILSKTKVTSIVSGMQTQQLANSSRQQELNYQLFIKTYNYCQYCFLRATLVEDIGVMIHESGIYGFSNEPNQDNTYLVSMLCFAISLSCLQQLRLFIKQNPKKLPDGSYFDVNSLVYNRENALSYYNESQTRIQKQMEKIERFLAYDLQIINRSSSCWQMPELKALLMRNSSLPRPQVLCSTLRNILSNLKRDPLNFRDTESMRAYAFLRIAPHLFQQFPDTAYDNRDSISKFRENIEKMPRDVLIKYIGQLNNYNGH